MKFRRVMTLAGSLLLSAGLLSGCASPSGSPAATGDKPLSGKTVAFMTVTQTCDICARITNEAKSKVEAAGGKVNVFVNEYDANAQAQQVNQAISQKVSLVILYPADATAVIPSLVRLKQAGIPTVIVDSQPQTDDTSLFNAYAGPKDEDYGKLAAQAMIQGFEAKGLGNQGNVIMVQGSAGVSASIFRDKGFRAELAEKAPGIKIVGAQPGEWDQTKSTDATAALLTQNPNVQGIYAMADNMMAGAIVAAQRAGLDMGKTVAVGTSCTIDGYNKIKDGTQYATVLQDPVAEGGTAGQLAVDILQGKQVEKFNFNKNPIVTQENLSVCDPAVK